MNNESGKRIGVGEVVNVLGENFKGHWKQVLRATLIYTVIYVVALVFLGVGFFLLVISAWLIMRWYAPHWKPAHAVMVFLLGGWDFVNPFPRPIPFFRLPVLLVITGICMWPTLGLI